MVWGGSPLLQTAIIERLGQSNLRQNRKDEMLHAQMMREWHEGYLDAIEDETRKPPPLMSMVRCMKAYETGIACKLSVSLIGINHQTHTAQMSSNAASGELLIIE